MPVTELLSPSSIDIGSETCLYVEKLLRSKHMWCDGLESMTKFGAMAEVVGAAAVRVQEVSQKGSQSPVVARAAVAVAFFTSHHSFIHL